MCTILNKDKSKLCKITHVVPQGSVLGPLFFLLYINDLPLSSKFKPILFANDADLHIFHRNLKTLQLRVNNEIKKVDYWMSINKLTLNYSKCKYMIISKKDIDTSLFTLKINNLSFERVDCIQCLGVLLDDKLYILEIPYTKFTQKTFKNMWVNFKATLLYTIIYSKSDLLFDVSDNSFVFMKIDIFC